MVYFEDLCVGRAALGVKTVISGAEMNHWQVVVSMCLVPMVGRRSCLPDYIPW
jgi:hypothetical protein